MKLYFKPGACSLSPHIVLREAGLPFELVKVDTKAGLTETGEDFRSINPKGYVPTLKLPDGRVVTEGTVIVQYLADLVPAKNLAPANGTFERIQLQEWLNYLGTELHKGFSPLFNPKLSDETKQIFRDLLSPKLEWLNGQISSRQWLTGDQFTVADAYLFTVLRWTPRVGLDLTRWPALVAYQGRVQERPAVRETLKVEGLLN